MREYQLKTIAEIIEVVDEKNIELFLVDFGRWLAIRIAMKSPDLKGVIESGTPDTFNWIDDGKNEINIKIEVKGQKQVEK